MEQTISNAIKSILAGLVFTIIIGYLFSERKYLTVRGKEITLEMYNKYDPEARDRINKVEAFNYKAGLISGSLITAILMFFVYEKKNKKISNLWPATNRR